MWVRLSRISVSHVRASGPASSVLRASGRAVEQRREAFGRTAARPNGFRSRYAPVEPGARHTDCREEDRWSTRVATEAGPMACYRRLLGSRSKPIQRENVCGFWRLAHL